MEQEYMMPLISVIFAIGLVGLGVGLVYIQHVRRLAPTSKQTSSPITRPTYDPVFGLGYKLSDFWSMSKTTSLPDAQALHKKLGLTYCEKSIFGLTVKTACEENIHSIYGSESKIWGVGPARYEGFRPFCGAGLLSTDGKAWERSRRLLKPFFQKSATSDLKDFEMLVEGFVRKLPDDGSTIDLEPLFSKLFADSGAILVFGQPLGRRDNEGQRIPPLDAESFPKIFQQSLLGCGLRMLLGPLRFLVPSSLTTKSWRTIHEYFDFYIENSLSARSLPDARAIERPHNVVDSLAQETSDRLEIRNQAIQAMIAAQDTLPTLLCNTIFCLSRSPDVWARLVKEVEHVKTAPLSIEEVTQLPTLRNILKESLRLYPVFPILMRHALTDAILPTGGGPHQDKPIFLPRGSRVVTEFWTISRDASIYGPRPECFEPDRWDSINPGPWQNLAFGGGSRSCLGRYKALGETSCVLIRLAQRYQKLESRDDRDWQGAIQLIVRNINGCKVGLVTEKQ